MVAFVPPPAIRIDDRVTTVLAAPVEDAAAAATAWRQAADLLSQRQVATDSAAERALIARLSLLADRISPATRLEAAMVAAFGRPSAALVAMLARDEQRVAATVLRGASLTAGEWAGLVPDLGPVGRGVLRARRDLPPGTVRLLATYGPADRLLGMNAAARSAGAAEPDAIAGVTAEPQIADEGGTEPASEEAGEAPWPEPPARPSRIAELVARIDAFRQARPALSSEGVTAPPPADHPGQGPLAETAGAPARFGFEIDRDGVLVACDAQPREPLIGLSLAMPAAGGASGVDAAAASAFRQRTGFRDARLTVAGGSRLAGDWQISGTPRFDPDSGRFLGYAGTARRPRPDERARPGGLGVRPDALRQLAHELRTPINAIAGFAQMIERQMLGPVGAAYRDRARSIAGQADRLLAAVEDLDITARIEAGALVTAPEPVDLATLLRHALGEVAPLAAERDVTMTGDIAGGAMTLVDPRSAARAVTRLMSATIAIAARGERIDVTLSSRPDGHRVAVDRPRALHDLDEDALLRMEPLPGIAGDSDAVAQLGFGFAIRLVANLARELGGRLDAGDAGPGGRLTICLPAIGYGEGASPQPE